MNTSDISIATLLVASSLATGCHGCVSPEDELRSTFTTRLPTLTKLVAMSGEDSTVVRIAPRFTWLKDSVAWPRPPEKLGFSPARWEEYRKLFAATGVDDGLVRSGQEVRFLAKGCGIAVSGKSFGYAFLPVAPANTIASLEKATEAGIAFIALQDNWYLFVQR